VSDVKSPTQSSSSRVERKLRRTCSLPTAPFSWAPGLPPNTDFSAATSRGAAGPFLKAFGLRVFPPPLPLPVGRIGQVWHARAAADPAAAWLRDQIAAITAKV